MILPLAFVLVRLVPQVATISASKISLVATDSERAGCVSILMFHGAFLGCIYRTVSKPDGSRNARVFFHAKRLCSERCGSTKGYPCHAGEDPARVA